MSASSLEFQIKSCLVKPLNAAYIFNDGCATVCGLGRLQTACEGSIVFIQWIPSTWIPSILSTETDKLLNSPPWQKKNYSYCSEMEKKQGVTEG